MNHLYLTVIAPRTVLAPLLVLLAAPPSRAEEQAALTLRRFALITGANDGGPKRARLRFATEDAKSMLRVLRDLGGILEEDAILLTNPDARGFKAGFDALRQKLSSAQGKGERLELLFYFSGHSDEQGILLGGERVTYQEIREDIGALPASRSTTSSPKGAITRASIGPWRRPITTTSTIGSPWDFSSASSGNPSGATSTADQRQTRRGEVFLLPILMDTGLH